MVSGPEQAFQTLVDPFGSISPENHPRRIFEPKELADPFPGLIDDPCGIDRKAMARPPGAAPDHPRKMDHGLDNFVGLGIGSGRVIKINDLVFHGKT
jgi:hypothetical protein